MLKRRTTFNPMGASAEVLLAEIKQCKDDPIYFISNYCKFFHPVRGLTNITITSRVEDIIGSYCSNTRILQSCERNTGNTTLALAYLLWKSIFHGNKALAFLTDNLASVSETKNKFMVMYNALPIWLAPKVIFNSRQEVMFEHYTSVLFGVTNISSLKGITVNTVIVDKFSTVTVDNNARQQDLINCMLPISSQLIVINNSPRFTYFNILWNQSSESDDYQQWSKIIV